VLAACLAVCALLAACSGVPHSSRPEAVRTVGVDVSPSAASDDGPRPGDDPRTIVFGFLNASLSSDARHSGARQFLTTDAGGKWNDNAVTVVSDYKIDVAQLSGNTATVGFSYQRIGSVDASGIYTPEKTGVGIGRTTSATFLLKRINNVWRIDQLPFTGLLIRRVDFQVSYSAHLLYFFDSSETQLVPDLRYSALEGQSLASWLLARMLGGPRQELAASVQTDIPDGSDLSRAGVTDADPIVVEIPGSSHFDQPALSRLATELAYTFGPIRYAGRLTLTDGGKPVEIPGAGTVFSTSTFPGLGSDNSAPGAQQYFLRNGGLISGVDYKPVPGPVGSGSYALRSVALHRVKAGALVAGINGGGLVLGPSTGPLGKVSLPARPTSSAEFRPGTSEAWLGVGGAIYRVPADRKPVLVPTPAALAAGLPPKGEIEALRFSPDGIRLAVVFRTADDSSEAVWIGSVVPAGESVSFESFEAVTPTALKVTDVAWKDATTLLMVAGTPDGEPQMYTVKSDGSYLDAVPSTGLPRGITDVAATVGQAPVVSAGTPGTVWIQTFNGWASLSGGGQTDGYAPAYAP
jgi:hypothetical protein